MYYVMGVTYSDQLASKSIFIFTVGVVSADRLICSMNMLYMELSYTGSLDQSTNHRVCHGLDTCKATTGLTIVLSHHVGFFFN